MKWEEPEQSSEERTEVLVQQVGQERVASASAGCGGLGLGLGHRYTRSLLYQIKRAAPGPRTQQTFLLYFGKVLISRKSNYNQISLGNSGLDKIK